MNINLEDKIIVVVEDDPNSYMATLELLRMEGVKSIHTCTSGEETIKLLESLSHVDLFLVDIYMPGETGYSLIQRIRSHPVVKDSKVVALTASVMYEDIRRVREAGFDSFIGKPVRPKRFANQIRQILDGEALWEWR